MCSFEKGKERWPGNFPQTSLSFYQDVHVDTPNGSFGPSTAGQHFHISDDQIIVHGVGLGGGSLINCGVALKPDPRVFEKPQWPKAIQGEARDPNSPLNQGYKKAEDMLEPQEYPDDYPELKKMKSFQECEDLVGGTFKKVPLTISFEDRVNKVGVFQGRNKLSGNEMTG